MVKFSRDSIIDYGLHWKISTGSEGEFRIEPQNLRPVIILAIVMLAIVLGLILFLPFEVPSQDQSHLRVAMFYLGTMVGIAIVTLFIYINRTQQRLGPFLILTDDSILLRNNQRFDRAEFESFGIFSKWENTANDKEKITYLTLKCKDSEEIEILRSSFRKSVLKLKQSIEKWIEENDAHKGKGMQLHSTEASSKKCST